MHDGRFVYSDMLSSDHLCVHSFGLYGIQKKVDLCRLLQKTVMSGDFPDSAGGNKCGNPSKR